MSKIEKALARLKSRPKDFTWKELQTVLTHLGYIEIKGGGSRRKFVHQMNKDLIILHEPHPQPILKQYAIDFVLDHLLEHKLI